MIQKIIKSIYRLIKYKAEWRKQFREIHIRKLQRLSIHKIDSETEKIILFFIPGAEYFSGKENISGGLISIMSLVQETSNLYNNSTVKTICSTFYTDHLVFKLTTFENNTPILRPKLIEGYFKNVKELILHIPELYVEEFAKRINQNNWIKNIHSVHLNILNQNIQLMPDINIVNNLKETFSKISITTAHRKYCNEIYKNTYGVPLHLFSTYVSPELYEKCNFHQKEKLILFSPDNYSVSCEIISYISKSLPQFKFQIIQGLTYESYKKLISKAMFVVTLGEGLDGYFVETYFSGGVTFAVKNLNFFDEKYLNLPCLFEDKGNLQKILLNLIEQYSNEEEYNVLNQRVVDLLSEDYSYSSYQNNLKKFYNKEYSYA